jgi:hypothetical protein
MILMLCMPVIALTGCGEKPIENVTKVDVPPPLEQLKASLKQLVDSGKPLGSGASVIQSLIDQTFFETDKEKAKALSAELDKMTGMTDAAKIKQAAKDMLSKL